VGWCGGGVFVFFVVWVGGVNKDGGGGGGWGFCGLVRVNRVSPACFKPWKGGGCGGGVFCCYVGSLGRDS